MRLIFDFLRKVAFLQEKIYKKFALMLNFH